MTEKDRLIVFAEVRRLGAAIKPLTQKDSVVVACCTQFDFVWEMIGLAGTRALVHRTIDHVVPDTDVKADLLAYLKVLDSSL